MRSGLLGPFDVQLCRVTLLLAKAIPCHSAEQLAQLNPNLDVDDVSQALDLNLQAPGIPEAKKALTTWRQREKGFLKMLGFNKLVDYFPAIGEDLPEDFGFLYHGKMLLDGINDVPADVMGKDTAKKHACGRAFFHLFDALLKVRGTVRLYDPVKRRRSDRVSYIGAPGQELVVLVLLLATYFEENDPAANWSAEMKHVLNGLGKAAHHVGHPCAKLVEEIATTISCAIDFIVQVGVLRQLGQDAAGRVEADSSGGVLATVLLQASKLTPTANRSQSQALVPSNPGEEDVTALTNLSTDPVIERLIQSEELLQCVRIKAERFEASVEDAYQKLTTSTQNRHKGAAAYWRTGLADDAALDVVLKCAKEHIDDIDGDAAESEYDKLSEVLNQADEFVAKAAGYNAYVPVLRDLSALVGTTRVMAKSCRALMCESLLAYAHNNCESLEWQARLVRTQLTDIMLRQIEEKDVHPVLLASARSIVEESSKKSEPKQGDKQPPKKPSAEPSEIREQSEPKKLRLDKTKKRAGAES
ncbi:hypothetical protein AK812_SmicGene41010 [Symbiodinium microadriaticum]|uniref:Uncharacterized protein n=1 Tax=Symbiodinium microadriaticum TaxID=2951 RepID=A0A1Q9C790_SYMMI|nr:hypothetical protein AK812_SmicGene41010 [Symbiodinium microadriaticum]